MPEDRTDGEIRSDLDSLLARVKKIEGIRKSQSLLRAGCLTAVLALLAFTGVPVYGSYRSLDSGKFTKNLKKELQQEFQPDLERLAKEGETKLLPALRDRLEASLKERLPRIQARYEKLALAKAEEVERKLDENALVYFREFEAELRRQILDEEMRLVFQKLQETQDRIASRLAEDVRAETEKLRPKIERIQEALRALASSPEVRGLRLEEAKDLFLEAALDLFKYELLPAKGDATEAVGDRDGKKEVR